MKYSSEKEIMNQLGINSWNQLSKEKLKRFVAMMPDMDSEVMTKIIEQFPKFTEFAVSTLEILKDSILEINKSNETSYKMAYDIIKDTHKVLANQLELNDLDKEERRYIIDNLMQLSKTAFEADANNKKFLNGQAEKILMGIGGALLAALVFVGGKILLESKNDEK